MTQVPVFPGNEVMGRSAGVALCNLGCRSEASGEKKLIGLLSTTPVNMCSHDAPVPQVFTLRGTLRMLVVSRKLNSVALPH